ncbi:MAG: GxxExxY protein [Verrucomicrobia bacterium]|nr:GxxExxY protein [Verrucomicrobiota bacterium]MDA1067820.1 GxxExxY protein [Verrucomicrobiota bacterium]
MEETNINKLADTIREMAFAAHTHFKNGFLEKVYENSLRNRLRKQGLKVDQQVAIPVLDEDDSVVGDYVADLIVEDTILIELKAVNAITNEHFARVLTYLRATNIRHGMLINFGSTKLQIRKCIQ